MYSVYYTAYAAVAIETCKIWLLHIRVPGSGYDITYLWQNTRLLFAPQIL